MKLKSGIKTYLLKYLGGILTIIFMATFLTVYFLSKSVIINLKIKDIQALMKSSSNILNLNIDKNYIIAETIAADEVISNPTVDYSVKKARMEKYIAQYNILGVGYIDSNALLRSTDGLEKELDKNGYFKDLMAGQRYLSNPSYNTQTGDQIIFIGVPIKNGDKITGAVTITVDSSYLSNITKDLKYNGAGTCYITNNKGTTIASDNINEVKEKYNVITKAEEDNSLKERAELQSKIITGAEGYAKISADGGKYIVYSPIANTNGWSMCFEIGNSQVNLEVNKLIVIFIVATFVSIAILLIMVNFIGENIRKRTGKLKSILDKLSSGDFNVVIDEKELTSKDEIGSISIALKSTIDSIRETLVSVKESIDVLAKETQGLNSISDEISSSSEAVSQAMNEIAQRNANQSSEIETINRGMEDFEENVKNTDSNIKHVSSISLEAGSKLNSGKAEMENLNKSVENFESKFTGFNSDINKMTQSVKSIDAITGAIKSIAEQTNLLALNAAIESARAGEAGKGFSVVAEEIRKLAEQSQKSLIDIENVIKEVIDDGEKIMSSTESMNGEMKSQRKIIEETINHFNDITVSIEEMLPKIKEISALSIENSDSANNIAMSIQSINAVSEELSATTEEVAATCMEFNGAGKNVRKTSDEVVSLIESLEDKIEKFKL